jgi:hypothetical protein
MPVEKYPKLFPDRHPEWGGIVDGDWICEEREESQDLDWNLGFLLVFI